MPHEALVVVPLIGLAVSVLFNLYQFVRNRKLDKHAEQDRRFKVLKDEYDLLLSRWERSERQGVATSEQRLGSGAGRCLATVAYAKVLWHGDKSRGNSISRMMKLPRLGSRAFRVHDEFIYFFVSVYDAPRRTHRFRYRTSGVVDLQTLIPWIKQLTFTDQEAGSIKNYIAQDVSLGTNTVASVTHFFNGLQRGHENIALQVTENTDEARLVVDFTSGALAEGLLIGCPTGTIIRNSGDSYSVSCVEVRPGVYTVAESGLAAGDVIRMDFRLNLD